MANDTFAMHRSGSLFQHAPLFVEQVDFFLPTH